MYKPPTYFKENEFMAPMQLMVATYGIPRYQEYSPALFSTVTFPFLFGVMFGDIGHGLGLFIGGALLMAYSSEIKHHKVLHMFYPYRFLITMMGFFATFWGVMYNDLLSVGIDLFGGSRWVNISREGEKEERFIPLFDPTNSGKTKHVEDGKEYELPFSGPYPMGVDPVWHGAANEMNFMNSLKMKLAVVLGVVQMMLGLGIRVSNNFFERNKVDFLFETIPMIVYMLSFFWYMDYLIMYKWVNVIEGGAPSIINGLILMIMGTDNQDSMYTGQVALERKLFFLICLSPVVLLIPKPLCLYAQHRWQTRKRGGAGAQFLPLQEDNEMSFLGGRGRSNSGNSGGSNSSGGHEMQSLAASGERSRGGGSKDAHGGGHGHGHGEGFDISEIGIHQAIETIEYTLGCVSHTASYLRLWALSLAHQQLSVVFFDMTVGYALSWEAGSGLAALLWILKPGIIYVMFAVWIGINICIFYGMEMLGAAMHTLRLHWVEFQQKFYHGDGVQFEPYKHARVVEPAAN